MVQESYGIGEAAQRTGLSLDTLRYYEREGLLEHIERNSGGHRRFSEQALNSLHFITKMRSAGMPIRELRTYLELVREGDSTKPARVAMLQAHRERVVRQIDDMLVTLEIVDLKIAMCERDGLPVGPDPCAERISQLLNPGTAAATNH